MEKKSLEIINLVATFFTLIPIAAGILNYKSAGKSIRLFLFFLIYGFVTDMLVWLLMNVARPVSYFLFIFYSLMEAIFLFWFIRDSNSYSLVKKIIAILALLMIPYWIITQFIISSWENPSALFDATYQILISILSAYSLLKLAEEKTELQKLPIFWFMLGVFFFCFTTFFISAFQGSELLQKIWFIHNLINLVLYSIFTVGFLTIPRSAKN